MKINFIYKYISHMRSCELLKQNMFKKEIKDRIWSLGDFYREEESLNCRSWMKIIKEHAVFPRLLYGLETSTVVVTEVVTLEHAVLEFIRQTLAANQHKEPFVRPTFIALQYYYDRRTMFLNIIISKMAIWNYEMR